MKRAISTLIIGVILATVYILSCYIPQSWDNFNGRNYINYSLFNPENGSRIK